MAKSRNATCGHTLGDHLQYAYLAGRQAAEDGPLDSAEERLATVENAHGLSGEALHAYGLLLPATWKHSVRHGYADGLAVRASIGTPSAPDA